MIDVDHDFIRRQRVRGFGWQDIANQVRVCVTDLRALCDPNFVSVAKIAQPAEPPARLTRGLRDYDGRAPVIPGSTTFKALERLGNAKGAWVPIICFGSAKAAARATFRLRNRFGAHIIEHAAREGYRLTPTGVKVYQRWVVEAPTAKPDPPKPAVRVASIGKRDTLVFNRLGAANGAFLTAIELWPGNTQSARNAISNLRALHGKTAIESGSRGYCLTPIGLEAYQRLCRRAA